MSAAPATPPSPPAPRGPLVAASLIVALGFILFGAGMIAGLRAEGGPRTATLLGHAAWQWAVAGFFCTLAGGLWLRRLVK